MDRLPSTLKTVYADLYCKHVWFIQYVAKKCKQESWKAENRFISVLPHDV